MDTRGDEGARAGKTHIQEGLWLLVGAGLVSPLLLLLEGILPSIENSSVDELPMQVLAIGLTFTAIAGVAKIVYGVVRRRRAAEAQSALSSLASRPAERLTATDSHDDGDPLRVAQRRPKSVKRNETDG